MSDDCIFCRIGSGEIPVQSAYEDEEFIAFNDLQKQAPVHVLLIPRKHYATLLDVTDSGLLGRAMVAVNETARRLRLEEEGFRVVINCKEDGGQTIYHLHIHIMGGRFLSWPPG
jgi:histidine triad (HIT) family protein